MGFYRGPKIVTDGLVLYLDAANTKSYPGTGSTWFDLSGNGRNFTGNSANISPSNGIVSGASWTCSSSLVGDILNNDYHSIFFTIRFNSSGTYPSSSSGNWDKIFEHTGSTGDRSPGIWRYPSNRTIHWRYNPDNSGADFGPSGSSGDFPMNTWFFVGVTKNGSSATSYVNGEIVATSSVSFPKSTGSSAITLFPSYPADILNIRNLMIYNRVLNPVEVKQLKNSLGNRILN